MVGEVGVGRFSRGLPLLPFFPPSFFSFFLLALALPSLTGFKKKWLTTGFLFFLQERGKEGGLRVRVHYGKITGKNSFWHTHVVRLALVLAKL